MDKKNQTIATIITAIIVLVLVYYFLSKCQTTEGFSASPYQSSKELDSYFAGSTTGVENDLVDNMVCHPSCCGTQWPVPFDGLNAQEIEKCIADQGNPGPFVRTNYTCANGINGVGCPCIGKKPYLFLVNRGNNAHSMQMSEIDPTFLTRNNIVLPDNKMTPYEQLQARRSMFVDKRKINDLELQREPHCLKNVQSYNSPITPKYQQLEKIY